MYMVLLLSSGRFPTEQNLRMQNVNNHFEPDTRSRKILDNPDANTLLEFTAVKRPK